MNTRIAFGIAVMVVTILSGHYVPTTEHVVFHAGTPHIGCPALRALCDGWDSIPLQVAPANQETRSVWDGVYTTEQAKRGQEVYGNHCSTCHGAKLEGAEEAPSLAGKGFLEGWDGLPVGALFEKTRKKMPRDNPGQLSRQQYLDVIAYLLSANKFPDGQAELPQDLEPLKLIRIDAVKPEPKPKATTEGTK
jgi:mono/diheme cytochrome c family protein